VNENETPPISFVSLSGNEHFQWFVQKKQFFFYPFPCAPQDEEARRGIDGSLPDILIFGNQLFPASIFSG
jgi:hypothetical protein